MSSFVGATKVKRTARAVRAGSRIERTAEGGYILRDGRRWIRVTRAEAFRFWLAMGQDLDRALEGQINKATSGGLDALCREYVRRRDARKD